MISARPSAPARPLAPRRSQGDVYARYAEAAPESDAMLEVVSGVLPSTLRGVLLRNGPGRLEAHGKAYGHPFDGDGMLHGFYFGEGAVRYRNRWIRTREFLEEGRAGRPLYRNFGTNAPGGMAGNLLRTRFKNPANTGILEHAGRALALWEGGLPHHIDVETLATRGRCDFDGVLARGRSPLDRLLSPELPFSAHPKVDPATGELVSFGLARGLRPRLMIYVVSADGVMAAPRSVPLDRLSYLHDFVLTERHLVFLLLPTSFDTARMLLGRATAVESLQLQPGRGARVLVVPRRGGAPVTFEMDPVHAFHHLNGFDDGDDVVVDSFVMDTPPPIADMGSVFAGRRAYPEPRLTRLRLDLRRRSVARATLFEQPMEFGSVAPADVGRGARVGYALACAPGQRPPSFTAVVRVDLETRRAVLRDMGDGYPSEPIHARARDGRALLLTVVYRPATHRSELHVLDAGDLRTECVLALPQHVPPGLHGTFLPR